MGMLSRNILDLLQLQYKHEMSNHFRYIARSSWAKYRGFDSAGDFLDKESIGESGHAKIVRDYIEQRNETIIPCGFEFEENCTFTYYDELFTTAQKIEQLTTDMLNNIYAESIAVGDFMTSSWVQQLIIEQIEEENTYQSIIDRITQRGGGGDQITALNAFRKDISATHDIEMWLREEFND